MNQLTCHDCGKKVKQQKDGQLIEAVVAVYDGPNGKISIIKCKTCFEKSKELKNFQECEVYSRVVGYLRPINQWNPGKRQEFFDRKHFKKLQ